MIKGIKKRMQAGGESGFTLIELLVVIIIIAILAAIAIPMYLSQRQKGWDANAQSDLRNAAVAQESYFTDHSSYTRALLDLDAEGYNKSADITLTPVSGDAAGYCMEAFHTSNAARVWSMSSATGDPQLGACAAVVP
ncbi:MAG: type IV pilin protein [Thermoleophilia bacterium]